MGAEAYRRRRVTVNQHVQIDASEEAAAPSAPARRRRRTKIAIALTLLLFAIVPNEAARPPPARGGPRLAHDPKGTPAAEC